MSKKDNKIYDSFTLELNKSVIKKSGYYSIAISGYSSAINYWNNLSYRNKCKLVSDSRWNHYPMSSYTATSRKKFGVVIGEIVTAAFLSKDKESVKALESKSGGVFALYALDAGSAKTKINMARRLMNSPDARLRTRCARILPVNKLKPLLTDKNYGVRNIAINRIGMVNCYDAYIPSDLSGEIGGNLSKWEASWLCRRAVILAEYSEIKHLIELAKKVNQQEIECSSTNYLLERLIEKADPDDIPFLLGLSSNQITERVLAKKLKHL